MSLIDVSIRTNRTENIVPFIAAYQRPSVYVEVGVNEGHTIEQVAMFAGRSIGFDIKPPPLPKNYEYFNLADSPIEVELPRILSGEMIEMAFIDGDHTFEQTWKDFLAVWPLMADQGLIFFHDVYPPRPEYCGPVVTDPKGIWFGDSYKVADWIQRHMATQFEIVTIPRCNMAIARKTDRQVPWEEKAR